MDTSVLNRIFDDQTQARIYIEASATLLIFILLENETLDIVSSEVLNFENEKNPYKERRIFVQSVLKRAKSFQKLNEKILKRAQELEKLGIRGLDALHLACVESLNVDCFLTCDDKIIKRYRGPIMIKNPVEFILSLINKEEEENND